MSDEVYDEQLRQWAVSDALTSWLSKHHDGKWNRHFDTFESIEWKEGVVPPSRTWYLFEKDNLENEEYKKLKEKNDYMKIAKHLPQSDDMLYSLFLDIDDGKFGENAKTSKFYSIFKTAYERSGVNVDTL